MLLLQPSYALRKIGELLRKVSYEMTLVMIYRVVQLNDATAKRLEIY
jgi:hypothetical protein